MNELLLRMLASTLWRNIHDTSFQKFQQCLLYSLSGNITSNRRIISLAGYLVYLIDEYNTPLRLRKVIISLLEKP